MRAGHTIEVELRMRVQGEAMFEREVSGMLRVGV